jgi:hypothetical protein
VLRAEVDRLQREVAELQQANAALPEALSVAEMRLISSRARYNTWGLGNRRPG